MGCLITNGISRACDFAVGGIKGSIYILNDEDVTEVAYDATGQVTGVTLTSGSTVYEFQVELNSGSLTQSLQAGQVSRFVSQVLVMSFASLTQAKIETLNDLSLTTMQAIIQSNDGNWYMIAENGSGLKATALEVMTGAADTDDAVATLTLTGSNKGYAPTVAAGVLTALGI